MPDNPPTSPRPRWLRFGLRKMFVMLTVFSLWLGWQAKIVRDRQEAVSKLQSKRGTVIKSGELEGYPPARISFWRKILGDEPYSGILAPPDYSLEEMGTLCEIFPEANLVDRWNSERQNWDKFKSDDAATTAKRQLLSLFLPIVLATYLIFELRRFLSSTN